MEVITYPACPYQNLRVYRFATLMATDLFWLSRRFLREDRHLTEQLRRTARTVTQHIRCGWNKRYSGSCFRHHFDEANYACVRLDLWIFMAYQSCFLTDEEHEDLQTRLRLMQQMLIRLHDQRLTLL